EPELDQPVPAFRGVPLFRFPIKDLLRTEIDLLDLCPDRVSLAFGQPVEAERAELEIRFAQRGVLVLRAFRRSVARHILFLIFFVIQMELDAHGLVRAEELLRGGRGREPRRGTARGTLRGRVGCVTVRRDRCGALVVAQRLTPRCPRGRGPIRCGGRETTSTTSTKIFHSLSLRLAPLCSVDLIEAAGGLVFGVV